MNPLYPAVAERAEYRCEYCHAPQDAFNALLEVEHILPRKAGGSDESSNLARRNAPVCEINCYCPIPVAAMN